MPGRAPLRRLLCLALLALPGCAASKAAPAEIQQLLEVLRLEPGMHVADVGAGDGEWSEILAQRVGPGGHVYATEVDEDDLEGVRDRLEATGLDNFTAILGDQESTGLPAGCCDAILLRLVYHHFTDPPRMRESLRTALRAGGLLVVVEISPQKFWPALPGVPERDGHGIAAEDLIEELTSDGFEIVARFDDWEGDDDHHCVVFRKSGSDRLPPEPVPWPIPDWPRSSPGEQGLDPAPLDRLVTTILANEEIRNIHSLLIVRNGHLVVEEYFDGHEADELHMLQSVSKSFTSALVGIAIEDGKIEGVEEKVVGFFPGLEDEIDHLDDRKRRMTLDDLLTMRSGTDYHERGSDSPHSKLNRMSRGWTEFILDRPMISEPGTEFRYDSGAVILTSAILKARYGVHADTFAREHLFKPLGIQRYDWYANSEGHPHTGGGLELRSRDMARFGLLYLRGGRWGNEQVVPADWVATSLSRHVTFDPERGRSVGYGYWWWVLPPDPEGAGSRDIYGAFGFRGQYIFLVPEHDMVVVVTAGGRDYSEERAPQDFLYSHILPAAHPRTTADP